MRLAPLSQESEPRKRPEPRSRAAMPHPKNEFSCRNMLGLAGATSRTHVGDCVIEGRTERYPAIGSGEAIAECKDKGTRSSGPGQVPNEDGDSGRFWHRGRREEEQALRKPEQIFDDVTNAVQRPSNDRRTAI